MVVQHESSIASSQLQAERFNPEFRLLTVQNIACSFHAYMGSFKVLPFQNTSKVILLTKLLRCERVCEWVAMLQSDLNSLLCILPSWDWLGIHHKWRKLLTLNSNPSHHSKSFTQNNLMITLMSPNHLMKFFIVKVWPMVTLNFLATK